MATTTSSPFLALPCFSAQIAGSHTATAPAGVLVLRIRCWKRFAASRCEVSLVPAWFPRPLPRRRNALRDKAPPLWLPPVVPHQVRRPYDEAPKLEFLDNQEQKSGCLDAIAEPAPNHKDILEISGVLDASRSGNVASESELGSEKDAIGVTGEEITFSRTGAGPVFSVYEGPDGNVVRIEMDEDEIIDSSEAAMAEGVLIHSACPRVGVMAMELEHGKCAAPKSRSLFQFVTADRVESQVLNEGVSVVQRNALPLQSFAWSGLAALCCVCIVFVVSKLIQTKSKAHQLRRLFYMHRPGMEWAKFDKGNLSMLKYAHGFLDGLQRRPCLDRKELMNNIKQTNKLREWLVLINSFSCRTVANADDARITEIRRMAKEIHRPEERIIKQISIEENNSIVFPHLIVEDDKEVSIIYGYQADVNNVEDSSKLSGISLSGDKVEETVEQTVDMENGEAVMSTSVKDDDGIGEMELSEPGYNNDRATGAYDRTSDMATSENEAQIGFADYYNVDPNMIRVSELESKEAFSETCAHNLEIVQGTKSSVPFVSYHQKFHAKDNSQEFRINVVSERADGSSSDCFDQSSELRNKKTPMDISVNDVNVIQNIEAPRTSAKRAHKAQSAHNINIIGEEECKSTIMTDIVSAPSSQQSRGEPIDMKRDSMQLAQEPKPSISSSNGKQPTHV